MLAALLGQCVVFCDSTGQRRLASTSTLALKSKIPHVPDVILAVWIFCSRRLDKTATIRHGLDLKTQSMTEQVSWKIRGKRIRRDPTEPQRLFFPQELRFYLEAAGFDDVRLMDGYRQTSKDFSGRRLIAVAEKQTHDRP